MIKAQAIGKTRYYQEEEDGVLYDCDETLMTNGTSTYKVINRHPHVSPAQKKLNDERLARILIRWKREIEEKKERERRAKENCKIHSDCKRSGGVLADERA